jgi:hypothetical protein
MDRRKAERYKVSLRCFLSHAAFAGDYLTGSVENLSRLGLLVRFGSRPAGCPMPPIGTELEIDVELPTYRVGMTKRSLHCFATVLRYDADQNGDLYFAASISELNFHDLPLKFHFLTAAAAAERQVV